MDGQVDVILSTSMKRIPHRIFTAEFKREAIKLITKQGLTLAEAGRKLDVATKLLRTWMDQQERGKLKPSLGASKLTADQQRIPCVTSQLRHEDIDEPKRKLLGQRADGELLWHTQNGKPASLPLCYP
jgi:transposase